MVENNIFKINPFSLFFFCVTQISYSSVKLENTKQLLGEVQLGWHFIISILISERAETAGMTQ